MASNTGIWHKTTLQAARDQQTSVQTTTIVGRKRQNDGPQNGNKSQSQTVKRIAQFQPASAITQGLPRLVASEVTRQLPAATQNDTVNDLSEYSQRRAFPSTPTPAHDALLKLSHPAYKLPKPLVANFEALGIKSIYPWQKQCLLGPGLLNGEKNLVYSAPTGGGKSLVADVLMLKKVLEDRDAKALLVLPYVALVQEKVRWLRNVVQGISREAITGPVKESERKIWRKRSDEDTVRVIGFFGGSKVRQTWADFDIGVCTIEKANSLVNTAIDDGSITNLKVMVLDELHMIDDDHRGYLLELLATKLLSLDDHAVQIIGMSATLTNIKLLATWFQGHFYETHYRPVPIEEHLVYDGRIYAAGTPSQLMKAATQVKGMQPSQTNHTSIGTIAVSNSPELKDPVLNSVVALANETARAGYGVLVFASSRAGCESDALIIGRVLPPLNEWNADIQEKRTDLLGDLRSLPGVIDPVLEQTIPHGVAFHHAGLTTEERDLIANAYDCGTIKVCVATCSLAAGINLPARRVILHNARMGRDLVGPSMLRQMRGRAGRKGKDEVGETYLCCRQKDLEDVMELMQTELPQVTSCLTTKRHRIQRALLEAIAVRLATSRDTLDEYVRKTLLYQSMDTQKINEIVETSLADLRSGGFIESDNSFSYQATQLGKAIVTSSLDPEDGVFIHKELKRALQAFVMDGEMHVLYTFTPVQEMSVNINWKVFSNEIEDLDESGLRVLRFLGLKPTEINRMMRGGSMKTSTPEEKDLARVYHRFYLALQLQDICNEMSIYRVAQKYDMPRGTVQTLAQTCQGFAAGMIKFCEQMGWGVMAAALDHFTDRLRAGAKSDLLALAKITFVKSRTARVFWDNGLRSIAAVANADPQELVPILMQAQPNEIRPETKDEEIYKEKLLNKAKVIADSANRLWQIEMQQEIDEEL
ncbi:Helicase and polymerase-containing protein TEBICHI [Cytospora mali]|uniref:Helicase and polymerase-containing protein TEBICHI n=1 Tax=Cytospora mali TaxID=578113 RepID=A0A194UQY6_CYTMA|nr:Helicase and polymerase-containing protein TEBICHI [Valsa mali var. pyri (nom. inval.)]